MIQIKQPIGIGTVIEFTEFDKTNSFYADRERETFKIGEQYLIKECDELFVEIGMILVEDLLLKDYQFRVVNPVQKSIAMVQTDLHLGTKDFHFYEVSTYDRDNRYGSGVSAFVNIPETIISLKDRETLGGLQLAFLDCEILEIIKKGA